MYCISLWGTLYIYGVQHIYTACTYQIKRISISIFLLHFCVWRLWALLFYVHNVYDRLLGTIASLLFCGTIETIPFVLVLVSQLSSSHPHQPLVITILHADRLFLKLLHVRKNMYFSFCVCLISLSIKLFTFIYFAANDRISFFLWENNIPRVYIPHFLYLFLHQWAPGLIPYIGYCV
jgi:hypothetical protein